MKFEVVWVMKLQKMFQWLKKGKRKKKSGIGRNSVGLRSYEVKRLGQWKTGIRQKRTYCYC